MKQPEGSTRTAKCPGCMGSGGVPDPKCGDGCCDVDCPLCGGQGWVTPAKRDEVIAGWHDWSVGQPFPEFSPEAAP